MKVKMFENKTLKWVFLSLFILTSFAHFAFSLQRAEQSSEVSKGVTEVVVEVINDVTNSNITVEEAGGVVRKVIGHFMWFGLIGIFGYLTFRSFFFKKYYLTLSIGIPTGFVIALISELLQMLSSGRSCEFKDMMIDFGGYLTAFLVFIIVYLILFLVNKKKENEQI